ncbi:MAG: ABC transporter ATP-binding protein [Gammaproteobacteria bacterium]|nr:ABC transporter ATP-binding protein [Gammaproteobacteria bacterium]
MTLLVADSISISFGGVKAVNQVSFAVKQGELFSIMGPNGAGKTTVLNLISRFYDVDEGNLTFEGEDITQVKTHQVATKGIARTFQNTELFEHETVLSNLLIAHQQHKNTGLFSEMFFLPKVKRQELSFRRRAEDIIDLLDLQGYRDQMISSLPFGIRKVTELARALSLEPKLLLLDEPSSGLNPEETEDLSFWIEDIKEELGITIIMVEHDMNLLSQVSDRVLVMADGSELTTGTPEEATSHPDVIKAYLGD